MGNALSVREAVKAALEIARNVEVTDGTDQERADLADMLDNLASAVQLFQHRKRCVTKADEYAEETRGDNSARGISLRHAFDETAAKSREMYTNAFTTLAERIVRMGPEYADTLTLAAVQPRQMPAVPEDYAELNGIQRGMLAQRATTGLIYVWSRVENTPMRTLYRDKGGQGFEIHGVRTLARNTREWKIFRDGVLIAEHLDGLKGAKQEVFYRVQHAIRRAWDAAVTGGPAATADEPLTVDGFAVIYDDKRRKTGASHTLHRASCSDVKGEKSRWGQVHTLTATDVEAALAEAQYQGLDPGDASNLGDVELAPCARS